MPMNSTGMLLGSFLVTLDLGAWVLGSLAAWVLGRLAAWSRGGAPGCYRLAATACRCRASAGHSWCRWQAALHRLAVSSVTGSSCGWTAQAATANGQRAAKTHASAADGEAGSAVVRRSW